MTDRSGKSCNQISRSFGSERLAGPGPGGAEPLRGTLCAARRAREVGRLGASLALKATAHLLPVVPEFAAAIEAGDVRRRIVLVSPYRKGQTAVPAAEPQFHVLAVCATGI